MRIVSEETKMKMRLAHLGTKRPPRTEEWKENLSIAMLRRKEKLGYINSPEARAKVSLSLTGRKFTNEHIKNIGLAQKGRIPWNKGIYTGNLSVGHRMKISYALRGENGGGWKGGITSENKKIRHSIELRLWREAVFSRDNWTCQDCGQRTGTHNAHHLKPFSTHPELRTSIDNGITLCVPCHQNRHQRGR